MNPIIEKLRAENDKLRQDLKNGIKPFDPVEEALKQEEEEKEIQNLLMERELLQQEVERSIN